MVKGCGKMSGPRRGYRGIYSKIASGFVIPIFILLIVFFSPVFKSFIYQQLHRGFIEQVDQDALSANIKVVQLEYRDDGDIVSTAVSAGAGGVVFRREGNRYYALTARHVVADIDSVDQTRFVAMGYDDLDYADALDRGEKYRGIAGYYQQFPEAAVEFSSDPYDLAIISFVSEKDLAALPVSDKMPAYGDKVAAMSNPHGKRNTITVGRISSRKEAPFGDEAGKMQHGVIRHTCLLSEGSSGSALLGENLEIVGINLGGGGNLFRRHLYGMAMPANRILDFLEEWGCAAPEGVLIPPPAGSQ